MFSKKEIQLFEKTPTPFYYYNLGLLQQTLDAVKKESEKYNFFVHYALKANANDAILKRILKAGLGADCVSGNEVKKAVESGFRSQHIVFAGVGKSDEEIKYAISKNIFCFNCESIQELEVINDLAKKQKKTASVALRINPNVNANTHQYITTGLEENKFGINMWELDAVAASLQKLRHIKLIGLHFHIGSQITDLAVFKSLCLRVNEIQKRFASHRIPIENLNLGGGLGINYHEPDKYLVPDFKSFFKIFHDFLDIKPKQKIHFELGRAIVGQCGTLISKVLYVKKGINTSFVILDAGMTELIRPALYQSYHKIEKLSNPKTPNSKLQTCKYDVVGPICESSDCFGKAVMLPPTQRGDLIAIRTTGAYGEVMASNYNLRSKTKAVYSSHSL